MMDKVATLLARARAETGLDDFGDDGFREGLDMLVGSALRQARFTARGQAMFEAQVVGLLSRRLEVEHWYARHPGIDDQQIVAPVIGLGLPRTGSTALSCLLAEDPAARSIRMWESDAPCPPPETATQRTDPRIARTGETLATMLQQAPGFAAMLPLAPEGPMECQNFMAYDFKSNIFTASAHIPAYADWLYHRADLVPTYRYVKRVLKLLQWRCPPYSWRLKNPAHMLFIDALDQVFPDARYWMTHRDVASVIPSMADLYNTLSTGLSDHVDRAYLGRLSEECWTLGVRRIIAFRDAGQDHRFYDIHFEPFQRAPIAVIEQLYQFLGEPFTDQARARMQAWRDSTPRDKHGRHHYDPGDYGLDPAALHSRLQFYTDRFSVGQAA